MMIIILKLKKKNSNDNYSKNSNNGNNDAWSWEVDWPPLLAWNGTISTKATAIKRGRYAMHVAMVAKFLDLLNENVTFIMTFLCLIALRVKLVDHTFRLSFDNANVRLCPKRLLKWRGVATMVTWRHTLPFFPPQCLTDKNASQTV